ncbi:hypothetical protein D3C84_136040 [compost metagenome]
MLGTGRGVLADHIGELFHLIKPGFDLTLGQFGNVCLGARNQFLNLTIEFDQTLGLHVRTDQRGLQFSQALGITHRQQFAHAFELLFGGGAQRIELQLAELLHAGKHLAADLLQQVKIGFLSFLKLFCVKKSHVLNLPGRRPVQARNAIAVRWGIAIDAHSAAHKSFWQLFFAAHKNTLLLCRLLAINSPSNTKP